METCDSGVLAWLATHGPVCAPAGASFAIGGISIGIDDPCFHAQAYAIPSLEPFRLAACVPDILIRVDWVRNLPAMQASPAFDSGCTWRVYQADCGLQFDFFVPASGTKPYKRLLIDRQFTRATLQISEEHASGNFPLTYPLDELLIMHRLTQERAIELHGAGIVRADGVGNLFVGHSGAGKSTTTRLWTEREGVEVLSDDRIIVRRDTLANHSKSTGVRMYGTPWHGEAMYASPASAPLARIFVLEHGVGNVLTGLTPSQAVAELFARSFVPFHNHEYVEAALNFLQELADTIPVYRYSFEPNQGAVDQVLKFCD